MSVNCRKAQSVKSGHALPQNQPPSLPVYLIKTILEHSLHKILCLMKTALKDRRLSRRQFLESSNQRALAAVQEAARLIDKDVQGWVTSFKRRSLMFTSCTPVGSLPLI